MDWTNFFQAVLIALIPAIASFVGVYVSNRKSAALMEYRLQELEKKVEKHNEIATRTIQLEGRMTEAEHDIKYLKEVVKT